MEKAFLLMQMKLNGKRVNRVFSIYLEVLLADSSHVVFNRIYLPFIVLAKRLIYPPHIAH